MTSTRSLLESYDLAVEPADPELVQVARLAAALCGVPTATVNLLDDTAQHQVATHGFPGSATPREEAMCDVTVREPRPVVLADAAADPRFADNPWVSGRRASVRFYASHQLHDADGAVVGTLCAFDEQPRDLSAQQREALGDLAGQTARLLEQRRAARALEEQVAALGRANAELDAFAGRVAHDLKSPLTGVLGFLHLATTRGGEVPPLVGTCLQQATVAAERLQGMLDGLLLFATSGAPAPLRETDLDALLADVLADLAAPLERAGAVVGSDPLGTLVTDPVLLSQVLQNLVGNAAKYRREESGAHVRVSRTDDGSTCVLVVADDGRGIPASARGRVFELFRRAPNAGDTPGSGIGLATCARSVEALGGDIDLSDTPGGGLTVTVRLPQRG